MSCYASQPVVNRPTINPLKKFPRENTADYVKLYLDLDNDGNYEINSEIEKPEPKQGKDQWQMDFHREIKYPAIARENSIGGIVVLNVSVNELGFIDKIEVTKKVSEECDFEAKRAFLKSMSLGYEPLKLNEKPVRFKIDVPVGFWLE